MICLNITKLFQVTTNSFYYHNITECIKHVSQTWVTQMLQFCDEMYINKDNLNDNYNCKKSKNSV